MPTFTTMSKGKGCPHIRRQGFTIIELLVVSIIAALMVGAVLTSWTKLYKQMQLQKCAKQIMLTARYARTLAIEQQSSCTLVFNQQQKRIYLLASVEDEETGDETEGIVSNEYVRPVQLDDEVGFELLNIHPSAGAEMQQQRDDSYIVFRADGSSDAAVIQVGDGKRHCTVYIQPATGKVKMQDGPAEEITPDIVDLDLAY